MPSWWNGRHGGLGFNMSTLIGILCVNASKFGESFPNGNAEPSLDIFKEGVET